MEFDIGEEWNLNFKEKFQRDFTEILRKNEKY